MPNEISTTVIIMPKGCFILLFILLFSCSAKKRNEPTDLLVIDNINVVDVLTGKIIRDQTVVIKKDQIYFIGDKFPEASTQSRTTIDGTGKYLSPGFWDMHFHLCWDNKNDSLLYPILLKNGITGIRDMGGELMIMRKFKEDLSNGTTGPHIYAPGPIIDGNPPIHADFSMAVDNKTAIIRALDSLKNAGVDFFKTYSLIKEPELRAISAYSKRQKIPFSGHLSEYIEPEISIDLGQKSVEHLNRIDDIWEQDRERIEHIVKLMRANKTAICPTLITYELKTRTDDPSVENQDYTKYLAPPLIKEWESLWSQRQKKQRELPDKSVLSRRFFSQLQLANLLHKEEIMILAGSDFGGMPYVYPGISLHQELQLLVRAGMSNHEALKAATINPAIFMNTTEKYGSVAVGKKADLVILKDNPLENIENTAQVHMTFIGGRIVYQ